VFTVDPAVTAAGLPRSAANLVVPTEPTIAATDQAIVPVAGVAGHAIDPNAVATQLLAAASAGSTPVIVDVSPSPTRPTRTDAKAKALAEKANAISRNPLAGRRSATITSKVLRSWITTARARRAPAATRPRSSPTPTFVADPAARSPPSRSSTTSADRRRTGQHAAAPRLGNASPRRSWPARPPVFSTSNVPPPTTGLAEAKGGRQVATVTTPPAGEPVVNIHKIADTVRGMYIEPGQGSRSTSASGSARRRRATSRRHHLRRHHDTDVGGGVSQFATTTFARPSSAG
jgi:hypothetical protein